MKQHISMAHKINKRSDVASKKAFINELLNNRGFDKAEVVAAPADIHAVKDGQDYYFEIKMTKRTDTYFGAATFTEWRQAFNDLEHFRFVVAMTDESENSFEFLEFTPAEMLEASTIPPFKVYFNIDLTTKRPSRSQHRKGTVALTEDNFRVLDAAMQQLRDC